MNSNLKGKTGERELCQVLRDFGFEAHRGVQYSGGEDSPDIIHNLKGIHFECKRVERFQLYKSLEQAQEDAGNNIPIVAHRRNNKEWVVVMTLEDFITFIDKDHIQ